MSEGLISDDAVCIESHTSGLHEGQGPVDLGLFIFELVLTQGDVKPARVKECPAFNTIFIKVIWGRWFQAPCSHLGCMICQSHWKLRFRCGGCVRESPTPCTRCNSW